MTETQELIMERQIESQEFYNFDVVDYDYFMSSMESKNLY